IATSNGEDIAVDSVDRQSWRCDVVAGPLKVVCEFYAHDPSVRAAFLDDLRGFFNPTSLCLRIEGLEAARCIIRLEMPEDYGSWQAVTTLPALERGANGFGTYSAYNYWALVDYPVAMGRSVRRVEFAVAGVPHAFVLLGAVNEVDTQRLAEDLAVV